MSTLDYPNIGQTKDVPQGMPSGNNLRKWIGAVALAVSALMIGLKEKDDMINSTSRKPDIGDAHRDERDALIQGGFIQPEDLNVLDSPEYQGREVLIRKQLARCIYYKEYHRKGEGKLNTKQIQAIEAILAENETEVLWVWMQYTSGVRQYGEEHPITNSSNKRVTRYFQETPGRVQITLLLDAYNRTGLAEEVRLALSEKDIAEIAQNVVREKVHVSAP